MKPMPSEATLTDDERLDLGMHLLICRERATKEAKHRVAAWWNDQLCAYMDRWNYQEAAFECWADEMASQYVTMLEDVDELDEGDAGPSPLS